MNAVQSNRLSLFLMTGSLALLLVFLCFWLKNVYNDKYESLKKDTDYLFLGSIRTIEDKMLEEIYGSPFSLNKSDTTGAAIIKVHFDKKIDTFNSMAFIGEELEDFRRDSNHQLTVRSKVIKGKDKDLMGSLGLAIAIQMDSTYLDTLHNLNENLDLIGTLEKYVAEDAPNTDMPSDYRIVLLDNPTKTGNKLVSSSYTDLLSGQSYALEYEQHIPFLVKKMVPEMLFSVFLFAIIALAFFVVYQSLQKQRKLTQLKNDFVSNVTHELKTPITTVGVAIEALSDFEVLKNPERTEEYLNISKHELNRLSILVDKVLKMSLFEKKEPELKLESLDLNLLIKDILDTMKLQFEKLNAKVEFQTSKINAVLEGDKTHLTSVLYNLIDNALKYSNGHPEIKIHLENDSENLKLIIADKGIGIDSEYKEKIFEKFFRVPTGDKHNIKGYGLGLSYVASVIKKHQGMITVESKPGNGTSFSIILPKDHEQSKSIIR